MFLTIFCDLKAIKICCLLNNGKRYQIVVLSKKNFAAEKTIENTLRKYHFRKIRFSLSALVNFSPLTTFLAHLSTWLTSALLFPKSALVNFPPHLAHTGGGRVARSWTESSLKNPCSPPNASLVVIFG